MQLFLSFWGLFDATNLAVAQFTSLNAKLSNGQLGINIWAWSIPRMFQCISTKMINSLYFYFEKKMFVLFNFWLKKPYSLKNFNS